MPRLPLAALALIAVAALAAVACSTASAPGWTYAPAPSATPVPSGSGAPSAAPSGSTAPSAAPTPARERVRRLSAAVRQRRRDGPDGHRAGWRGHVRLRSENARGSREHAVHRRLRQPGHDDRPAQLGPEGLDRRQGRHRRHVVLRRAGQEGVPDSGARSGRLPVPVRGSPRVDDRDADDQVALSPWIPPASSAIRTPTLEPVEARVVALDGTRRRAARRPRPDGVLPGRRRPAVRPRD